MFSELLHTLLKYIIIIHMAIPLSGTTHTISQRSNYLPFIKKHGRIED